MIGALQIDNFEISSKEGELMLSFDLPAGLSQAFPKGLSGEPVCSLIDGVARLAYEESVLEFPGAPVGLLKNAGSLLCAQLRDGRLIAADFARMRK